MIYFAYPYTENPMKRTREAVEMVMRVVDKHKGKIVPIVPHIAFDKLLSADGSYADGYDESKVFVLDWELEIINRCDYICFLPYDRYIRTAGIHWERAFARRMGIPTIEYEELI